jgi:hypothetical protein
VNEAMHYTGNPGVWALTGKCVLKMRLMGPILVADLSPHNPRARRFLRELGAGTWDQMIDPKDCSVARGIGLAIAESGTLRGLSVQTVRESERSPEERDDNLVLFTAPGRAISGYTSKKHIISAGRTPPRSFQLHFREGAHHELPLRSLDQALDCKQISVFLARLKNSGSLRSGCSR